MVKVTCNSYFYKATNIWLSAEHVSFIELHIRTEGPGFWERCLVRNKRRVKNYSRFGLRSHTSQILCVDERVSNPRHECYSRPKIQHILVRKEVALPLTPKWLWGWILYQMDIRVRSVLWRFGPTLTYIMSSRALLWSITFDIVLAGTVASIQNTLHSTLTSVSIFYSLLSFYFSLPFCWSFFTRFIFYIHFFLFQLSLSSSYLMSCSIGWHSSSSFSRLRSCTMLYTVLHYKGKGKVLPRTGHERPEGCRGIVLLFL